MKARNAQGCSWGLSFFWLLSNTDALKDSLSINMIVEGILMFVSLLEYGERDRPAY